MSDPAVINRKGLLREAILPSLIGADCCSMIFWSRSLGDLLLFLWAEMGNFGGKKYQDDSENRHFGTTLAWKKDVREILQTHLVVLPFFRGIKTTIFAL